MKFFSLSLIAAAAVAETTVESQFRFMQWMATHNKSYLDVSEYQLRHEIWLIMDEFVKEVNAEDSPYTHTAAHNEFSDWTRKEFESMMGYNPKRHAEAEVEPVVEPQPIEAGPVVTYTSKDWRGNACLTAVKDQGQCGSCWAFSATETLESQACLDGTKNGSVAYVLSPQQLVDCSTANSGCNGGWYYTAWDYLETHGQETNSEYPYTAKDGSCKYTASKGVVEVTSSAAITQYQNDPMMAAID